MMLAALVLVPLFGGLLAWLPRERNAIWSRWICLTALAVDVLLLLRLWLARPADGPLMAELSWSWIPHFGIGVRLALDGLSLTLVLLTLFLGILAVATSWSEITSRVGFFHFNLMWILAGILGVFLAADLFLFYFCWELMLVPMYFLIGIWGHENRIRAAVKFFLFTQASGLLMLVSILGLVLLHYRESGTLTFAYSELLGTATGGASMWLMLGFFAAFAVKLPVVPFHTWLPDAHTEAPTAGSLILAGLLLKTGGYGLIRFAVPLFPEASRQLAPLAMTLGVIGILYGAILAFAQTDLKRMVAYTSVSHLGFVLLGVYAWNDLALQGAVMQMVCHGLSTGALFILAGALQSRLHTRDLREMGGLWAVAPRMGAMLMFFAMASLGLPGLGNFVGELLVLLGAFHSSPVLASLATVGLVLGTVYSLWIVQRVAHGPTIGRTDGLQDLSRREVAILGTLVMALLWLGLHPQPALDMARPALETINQGVGPLAAIASRGH